MFNNKKNLWLGIIIIIAGLIRLVAAINWQGLLADEIFSIGVAKQPVQAIWSFIRWEMHPPLHFYYLHYWIQLFGTTPWVIRLSSIIPSLISIYVIYKLSLKIFNSEKAAFYTVLLAAFSPVFGFYATWARMYSILILFFLSALFFFWQAIKYNKKIYWLLTALFNVLVIYTHLTALMILAIELLYIVYLKIKKNIKIQIFKRTLFTIVISFLMFTPWLWNFITVRLTNFTTQAWYFNAKNYDLAILNISLQTILVGSYNKFIEMIALVLFLIVLIWTYFSITKQNSGNWVIKFRTNNGLVFTSLVAAIAFLGPFIFNLTPLRFYLIFAAGLFLLLGFGLKNIEEKIKSSIFLGTRVKKIIVPLLLLMLLLAPNAGLLTLPSTGWAEVAAYIENNEQPNDKIITSLYTDLLQIKYAYKGGLTYDGIIDQKKRENSVLLTALKYNFAPTVNQDNVGQLTELTKGHNRIFLIVTKDIFIRSQEFVTDWFFKNGWRLEEKFVYHGFTSPQVWLLVKN